jgi:hypothetical protein
MKEEITPRKAVMRGALSPCCSLWAPIALAADAADGVAPDRAPDASSASGADACAVVASVAGAERA